LAVERLALRSNVLARCPANTADLCRDALDPIPSSPLHSSALSWFRLSKMGTTT
jgi:hypothetical protein